MNTETKFNKKLFLGLDYSTQQLKSLLYDSCGNLINEENIEYDIELPQYKTTNGVCILGSGVVCSPSAMWIEATDILFIRLSSKIDMSEIIAISGSAQQHATMFWATGTSFLLSHLDSQELLINELCNSFSRPLSPSWMDTSTAEECTTLEAFCGGKSAFQNRIGSTLAKRFSGPQIMKAFKDDKTLDEKTEMVTLVSNGMCSVMVGGLVGIDLSDAAGTGLQAIGKLEWDSEICSLISSSLQQKLGKITPSNSIVGYVSDYFVKRYNMNPLCQIVSFTGDNPSSVVGLQLHERDFCLSMGTSDTVFASSLKQPCFVSDIPLFVFPHPLYPETFVSLLCYKNGAHTRYQVCKEYCGSDWAKFSQFIDDTNPGNNGILGLFYDLEEITPPGIQGRYFYDSETKLQINERDIIPSNVVRSLIEGQLLAKYHHSTTINIDKTNDSYNPKGDAVCPSKLMVTGGASSNRAILQVASDIFSLFVYTVDNVNSSTLGSVFRAVIATEDATFSNEFIKAVSTLKQTCEPKDAEVYKNSLFGLFSEFYEKNISN